MCVIICLSPNQTIPYRNLENACYNNWHSFGLVTLKRPENKGHKFPYTMEVHREVGPDDGIDPRHVEAMLETNKDHFRILHLRHNTAGATTLENTHPFDVYQDDKTGHRVVFMHNGTLYKYKSKKMENGREVDDDSGPSDTKNFVDKVLIPFSNVDFGDGLADIENELFRDVITKYWEVPTTNRGILISNTQEPFLLGDWKEVNFEGQKILVSNDEYFYMVKRGPEHTRRMFQEQLAKQKAKEEAGQTDGAVVPIGQVEHPYLLLKTITEKIANKHPFFRLSESPVNILNDWEVYDRATAASSLCLMTRDEIRQILNDEETAVALIEWIFSDYGCLFEESQIIDEKQRRAEGHIAALKSEIEVLRSDLDAKEQAA